MDNLQMPAAVNTVDLFDDTLFHPKAVYIYHFGQLPSVNFIGNIDGEKSFKKFLDVYSTLIRYRYQRRYFSQSAKAYEFDQTILVLTNNTVIDFDHSSVQVFHDGRVEEFIKDLTAMVHPFRGRTKKRPLEINLIIGSSRGLELRSMEVKKTKLDIDLYYEEGFREVHSVILQRLRNKGDKGIILLHGLPGTGKTSYLRYLIGCIRKRVLFVSPSVAENLTGPALMDLLMNNPDTVLVIEDAENIIRDRRSSSGSSVSSLLNLSDGLLADFLNVQLICTFNSPLATVDPALIRKGRLIARYEFGKLSIARGTEIRRRLGIDTPVLEPMTLADLVHGKDENSISPAVEITGFHKRKFELQN